MLAALCVSPAFRIEQAFGVADAMFTGAGAKRTMLNSDQVRAGAPRRLNEVPPSEPVCCMERSAWVSRRLQLVAGMRRSRTCIRPDARVERCFNTRAMQNPD